MAGAMKNFTSSWLQVELFTQDRLVYIQHRQVSCLMQSLLVGLLTFQHEDGIAVFRG